LTVILLLHIGKQIVFLSVFTFLAKIVKLQVPENKVPSRIFGPNKLK